MDWTSLDEDIITCVSWLKHVVLKVYSILLSFPVEWISLDMTCGLLDMFMGLFMFHC